MIATLFAATLNSTLQAQSSNYVCLSVVSEVRSVIQGDLYFNGEELGKCQTWRIDKQEQNKPDELATYLCNGDSNARFSKNKNTIEGDWYVNNEKKGRCAIMIESSYLEDMIETRAYYNFNI